MTMSRDCDTRRGIRRQDGCWYVVSGIKYMLVFSPHMSVGMESLDLFGIVLVVGAMMSLREDLWINQ